MTAMSVFRKYSKENNLQIMEFYPINANVIYNPNIVESPAY